MAEHVPSASVLMAVFNAEEYLPQALDSILSQTFQDYEFIVIDDGSTDGSPDILRNCGDRRLRVYRFANMGLTRALNVGISRARGQYIVRMDADDSCSHDRLERQLEVFRTHPEVSFVATGSYDLHGDGRLLERQARPFRYETLPAVLLEGNMLTGASMAFRRKVVLELGGYDERFQYAQDYELWLRASWAGYRFTLVPGPLYAVRRHGDSISSRKRMVQRACDWKARREIIRRLRCDPDAYEWVDRTSLLAALTKLSWLWRDAGDLRAATEVVATIIRLAPRQLAGYKRAAALLRGILPTRLSAGNRPSETNL